MHDKVFFAAFEVAGHGKACFSGSAWMDTKGLSDLVRSPHALVCSPVSVGGQIGIPSKI
jgi:hypothetical protein